MNRSWRYFTGALLSALIILLLAIEINAAELKKFRLGYSTVGPAGAGLWMAKEIGAFEKYGIDADLIFISSGPVVVQALLGGDLHGGFAATNAVIAAVLGGAPLVSIMSLINRPYYRLWVQPEITRIEELRGKTLGVSRFGSVNDNMTRILLRKKNLEGAVMVRQFGGTTETAAAFLHRQIAGAVISALRVNAPMRMLVDLSELDFLYSKRRDHGASRLSQARAKTLDACVRLSRRGRGGARAEGQGVQGDSKIHPAQRSEIDRRALQRFR